MLVGLVYDPKAPGKIPHHRCEKQRQRERREAEKK